MLRDCRLADDLIVSGSEALPLPIVSGAEIAYGGGLMIRCPVELQIALRYLQPRGTFISMITMLSIAGVSLGVALVVIVLSVQSGVTERFRDRITGFRSHVVIDNGHIMYNAPAVLDELAREPEVFAASPFAAGKVILEFRRRISSGTMQGVNDDEQMLVTQMGEYLKEGSFELGFDGVVVGMEWARRNQALLGDKIYVYGPRHWQSLQKAREEGELQEIVLPDEFEIRGIFETGDVETDLNYFFCSLNKMQRLYNLADGVHGVAVKTHDPLSGAEALATRFNERHKEPLLARTWMDMHRTLFRAIASERMVLSFIMFVMIIVSALGLSNTLVTLTIQKTGEIGVLKALGATHWLVARIFSAYGLVVGLFGATVGVAAGLLLIQYRNPFSEWLSANFSVEVFPQSIHGLAEIPAVIDPITIAVAWIAAVLTCILAAVIPAIFAARIDPARALRSL